MSAISGPAVSSDGTGYNSYRQGDATQTLHSHPLEQPQFSCLRLGNNRKPC